MMLGLVSPSMEAARPRLLARRVPQTNETICFPETPYQPPTRRFHKQTCVFSHSLDRVTKGPGR